MNEPEHSSSGVSRVAATPPMKMVRRSCDLCNRMKIKCEREAKSCKHCAARNLECTFTARIRKKRVSKKTEYVAAVEERIQRMEVLIKTTGLVPQLDERASIFDEIAGQAGSSDQMSTLTINDKGSSQFIGASSAFSLFSPQGLQWIREKTLGYDVDWLLRAIAGRDQRWGGFTAHFWQPRPDAEQTPLPPKVLADDYVNAYFHRFNTAFPIYEETRFRALYERQYSLDPPTGAAWYASINIVIALGSAIAEEHATDKSSYPAIEFNLQRDSPWVFFRNACSKFTELLFSPSDIMAIQAIICMSFMLQDVPDPHPAYVLAATAARLSHSIGLHRSLDEFGLDEVEKKQRQNVFWSAYSMEIGVSLRSGRPPAMNDQDIAIALPQTTSMGFDHFRSKATLALLENRVYSDLYSAKAVKKSGFERLRILGRLDAELTRWRDALPLGYRPESELACLEPELMPVIMLHFDYYNCLTAIHRTSIHHGSWTSNPDDDSIPANHDGEKLNPRVYISSSLCIEAARNAIGLLQRFDLDRGGLIYMAMYYPLSATLTLFANLLQNPQSTEAFVDVELIGLVLTTLSRSKQLHQHLRGIERIFAELHRIAGLAVRDGQMIRLGELKRHAEESPDAVGQGIAYQPLLGQSTQKLASPDSSVHGIPQTFTYPDNSVFSFDQAYVHAADESFMTLPYEMADLWTQADSDDLDVEAYIWQL